MTTIQERRREAENTINRLSAQRESCVANLCRYEERLKLARRKLERIKRAAVRALVRETEKITAAKPKVSDVTDIPVSELPISDDPGIPDFLRRSKEAEKKDAETRATILQEQADRKKAKARGRIEKMKAKQRGDTKRMPLSGKAALAHIIGAN